MESLTNFALKEKYFKVKKLRSRLEEIKIPLKISKIKKQEVLFKRIEN